MERLSPTIDCLSLKANTFRLSIMKLIIDCRWDESPKRLGTKNLHFQYGRIHRVVPAIKFKWVYNYSGGRNKTKWVWDMLESLK